MTGPPYDDEIEQLVTRQLADEARRVTIDGTGLERIRARTGSVRVTRRGWLLPSAAVAATAAVGLTAGALFVRLPGQEGVTVSGPGPAGSVAAGGPTVDSTGGPVTSTPLPPRTSPGAPGAASELRAVPVYLLVDTPRGTRLAREFRALDVTESVVVAALTSMLTSAPDDPDYIPGWTAPAGGPAPVLGVTHEHGLVTVALAGSALQAPPPAQLAGLAVQQLVYTVTGALQTSDPVRITVDGRAVDRLWGLVDTGRLLRRADPVSTRLLVQLNDPVQGARSGPDLAVTGEAAAYEATLVWRVVRGGAPDGEPVAAGTATTSEGQRFAGFAFTVPGLAPGTYTVVVEETDPSDGAAGPPMRDTRTVTVG